MIIEKWQVAHLITNLHIHHDPDVSLMTLRYKLFQIIGCAKVLIEIIYVLLPVAMVTFIGLFRNWRYPNCICSETLNVV